MIRYDLTRPQEKVLRGVIKRESAKDDTLIAEHTFDVLNKILETKSYTEEQADLLNEIYKWYKL
jgi:hypothetical protein